MRPNITPSQRSHWGFQSTHPVRGATIVKCLLSDTHNISIHAPREGCDSPKINAPFSPLRFQSTHPVRGATIPKGDKGDRGEFQSTHPVRGATFTTINQICSVFISIHAPREGCDCREHHAISVRPDISIHAPREGCDPSARRKMVTLTDFNPRTP